METDLKIVERVVELAKEKGVSMTEIALDWLFMKGVTAPIVGATKVHHFADTIKSVDLELTDEEMKFLDEPYSHVKLSGHYLLRKPLYHHL